MVKIIEHSDYNAPIDNETIAWLNYIGIDNKQYIVKAFKYTESIWVIPQAVGIDKQKNKENVSNWDVYNEEYLETNEEKTNYLKDMTILFKRISSIPLGQEFLAELDYSCLIDKKPAISIIKNYNEKSKESIVKYQHIPINVTTFIQGNHILNNFEQKQLIHNEIRYSYILFCPNIAIAFFYHTGEQYFVQDPVLLLVHELIHGFHQQNGVSNTSTCQVPKASCSLEEVITVGGADLCVSDIELERCKEDLLNYREVIIEDINRNIKKLPKEHREYCIKKYLVTYEDKKFSTDEMLDGLIFISYTALL